MSFFNFFAQLRLRAKLLLAFASLLLLSAVVVTFAITSLRRVLNLSAANQEVAALELLVDKMELASQEFLYEGYKTTEFQTGQTSPLIEAFEENSTKAIATLEDLSDDQADQTGALQGQLLEKFAQLEIAFDSLVQLLQVRGFRDYGLEGSLRQAIHTVEKMSYPYDKASMLTLRRNEKDFFLRRDTKYQADFNTNFEAFRNEVLANSKSSPEDILKLLDQYRNEFNRIVAVEMKIGLTEEGGIRGELKKNFAELRPQLAAYASQAIQQNEETISSTQGVLITLFVVQILIGVALAITYAHILTTSIKEIRNATQQLAAGSFPDELKVRTSEEIGQTKQAFNQFIERIKTASRFAKELGEGNLQAVYDVRFANDVLAQSIIAMQAKLRTSEEQHARINWTNRGIAEFNELLKNQSLEITTLADLLLKQLVTYVKANQGVIYVRVQEGGERFLERVATYAYDKKKFVIERIDEGHGLIGQCALEQETIYLKEIPKDFVKITSGLGQATPRNVLLVPLKIQQQVVGVMELASFTLFEKFQIEFVEKIAENIASVIVAKQVEMQTQQLLTEARQRAEQLTQQEEEMRQNTEELQATQEEMERQRKELQEEIKELRAMLKQEFQMSEN